MAKVPHTTCLGQTIWVDEEVLYGELPELGDEFDEMDSLLEEQLERWDSLLEEQLERHHIDMLVSKSRISYECILERGYFSATAAEELGQLGFAGFQQRVPGLVIPIHDVDGNVAFHRVRPDNPRSSSEKPDKFVKYEQPARTRLVLDIPPTSQADLQNPNQRLWLTEGERKADSLASQGECVIGLLGIWGWKREGKPLPDWQKIPLSNREVCVAFDADIVDKTPVQQALRGLVEFLRDHGARVRIVPLEQVRKKKI